jgi:hypothetical protein
LAKGQSRDPEETPGAHVGRVQAPRDRKIVKLHAADHPRTVEFYEQTFKRVLNFKPLAKAILRDIDEELIARFSSSQMGIVQTATVKRALSGDSGVQFGRRMEVDRRASKVTMMQKDERRREFVLNGAQREEFIGGLSERRRTIARF